MSVCFYGLSIDYSFFYGLSIDYNFFQRKAEAKMNLWSDTKVSDLVCDLNIKKKKLPFWP